MRTKNVKFIFIILAIIFVFLVVFLFFLFNNLVYKKTYVISFEIGGNPGFDLNKTALTFGRIPIGGSAMRSINITNNFNHPLKFSFYISDNVKSFVSVSKNDFWLEPNKTEQIDFFVISKGDNKDRGKYSGKVDILACRWRC